MKNNWEKWLEKKLNPALCMVSADAIIIDGAARRILSIRQHLPESNTYSGVILSRNGAFMEVEIDTEVGKKVLNVELN